MAGPVGDNRDHSLRKAVREFIDAQLQGQAPNIDEFVRQYPELEDQIRQKMQNLQRIDTLFNSLVQADEGDFNDTGARSDLVGQKLGHFEIREMIGRGGMGVVYLAHDTRLDRSVAIKSIPPGLTDNTIARARFQREARLLAALNHPNIAVIHEILEQGEGVSYLVLEYVPGQTLAQRIAQKPLKLKEVLSIGRQVAEAIAAAHDKGIIHRDLKPGNIKIAPEGHIKVLDFGLAKALGGEATDLQNAVTQPGRVVGTPGYMSPEQACGQVIDKRTDVWSFGCVLYEMLTSRALFKDGTASKTVANLLQKEPDWQALPEGTPANIRVLLRRCLEKDPAQRLHDMADARIEISETESGTLETLALPGDVATSSRLFRRDVIRIALASLIAGILIAGAVSLTLVRPTATEPPMVSRLSIPILPDKAPFTSSSPNRSLAISPDGTRLVYAGYAQLYVRSLNDLEIKPIPGTKGAHNPFFSPDGQYVGFFTLQEELKTVSLAGGEPLTLLEGIPYGFVYCASWADDGTIVFGALRHGLQQISDDGGRLETLIAPAPEEGEVGYPQVLPGGKAILYSRVSFEGANARDWSMANVRDWSIEVLLRDIGKRQTVLDNASYAMYVRSGHLIFLRENVLMAAPFDVRQLKITGPSAPLADDVGFDSEGQIPQIAVSRNGTVAYVSGGESVNNELVWVDRHGVCESIGAPTGRYLLPRLSPDGRRIAVNIRSPKKFTSQVHIYNVGRGTLAHLTAEGDNDSPQWSPDGMRVSFRSRSSEGTGLFCRTVGDDTPAERVVCEPFPTAGLWPYAWSHNSNLLACITQDPKTADDIWIVEMDGDHKAKPFLCTKYNEFNPTFSPDGRWLAYVSDESGRPEIYLREYTDGGRKERVSTDGGTGPGWSHDGRELYYISGKRMMVVKVVSDPDFDVGAPELLFDRPDGTLGAGNLGTNYDVSADGRFLMIKQRGDANAQLICIQNWFEELKQLAPSGKEGKTR